MCALVASAAVAGAPAADWEARRARMVEEQLRARGIRDPAVLAAMARVPRHLFVPPRWREQAYADTALPIGRGQTISQPYVVARMTEAIDPRRAKRVLEIGTGSGYQAAVLAEIVPEVDSIEIDPVLAAQARRRLRRLGYRNVRVRAGDGFLGWPERAPYDAILVTAAAPRVPPPLVEQLAEGGRIVLPLGTGERQRLSLGVKREGRLHLTAVADVLFVPMRGLVRTPPSAPSSSPVR